VSSLPLDKLRRIAGAPNVLTGVDCSPYVLEGRTPEAVVFPGSKDDVVAILGLAAEAGIAVPEAWNEITTESFRDVMDINVTGTWNVLQAAEEAEIRSVAVAARERGRGIARDMLAMHMRRLAGAGCRTIFLEVDETNQPARRLYKSAGFREVGRREPREQC
jgi:ribosomal protein S18 acetylase RimI-like enzyme